MRTILIASPKGGCGKTTVATNLAAFYATAGKETVLIDCDRQGSSLHWAEKRAALAHPVLGMAGKRGSKVTVKVPSGTKRCIVDTAAGIRVAEVAELLDAADALLIPVMPSVIDLEASEAFVYLTGFFSENLSPSIAGQQSNAVADTLFPAVRDAVQMIRAGS